MKYQAQIHRATNELDNMYQYCFFYTAPQDTLEEALKRLEEYFSGKKERFYCYGTVILCDNAGKPLIANYERPTIDPARTG